MGHILGYTLMGQSVLIVSHNGYCRALSILTRHRVITTLAEWFPSGVHFN